MNASTERPRPAIWGPVLIATVFLAIIGGSAGWVIGTRTNDAERQAAQQVSGPRGPDGGAPAAGTGDTAGQPGSGVEQPDDGAVEPEDRPHPDRCPASTVRLAKSAGATGTLSRVLYVSTGHSEAWICVDSDHRLFYQGHRGSPGDNLIEGTNALFLTDVVEESGSYVARNDAGDRTTRYRVNRDELVIENAGGKERQPVVDARG